MWWDRVNGCWGVGQDRIGVLDGMQCNDTLFTFIPAAKQQISAPRDAPTCQALSCHSPVLL